MLKKIKIVAQLDQVPEPLPQMSTFEAPLPAEARGGGSRYSSYNRQ
jgi:hypothetical protein